MKPPAKNALDELASRLGVSVPTLRNWQRTGVVELPDRPVLSPKAQQRLLRDLAEAGRLTSGANRFLLERRNGARKLRGTSMPSASPTPTAICE